MISDVGGRCLALRVNIVISDQVQISVRMGRYFPKEGKQEAGEGGKEVFTISHTASEKAKARFQEGARQQELQEEEERRRPLLGEEARGCRIS